MAATPFKLRCMSFNIWAVPYVGVATDERIDALCAYLIQAEHATPGGTYDLIGFQEVFSPHSIEALHDALPKAGLPHIMHFVSGSDMPSKAAGSGLLIASRYPILDSAYHMYSAGGRPWAFTEWDWHSVR